MPKQRQTDMGGAGLHDLRSGRARSLRLLLAFVCLLVVIMMSTVQVCHVHSGDRANQGTRQGDQGAADHCPLCVAMHSALPANIHVAPEPLVPVGALDDAAADAERMFRWRFEMASRPPPRSHFAQESTSSLETA